LSYESFIIYNIDNLNKLDNFIIRKTSKLNKGEELIKELIIFIEKKFDKNYNNFQIKKLNKNCEIKDEHYNDNKDFYKTLYNFFESYNFKTKYPYYYKKMNIILSYDITKKSKLKQFIQYFNRDYNNTNISLESKIKNMIYKLFIYNSKINIEKIPPNYLGFDLVIKNFNCGNCDNEINTSFSDFRNRIIKRFIFCIKDINKHEEIYKFNYSKYNIHLIEIKTYYQLVKLIRNIYSETFNINFNDNIFNQIALN